ncbi:MAG: HD domain-containing protein [Treponema sp.]|nr:HD domain-containing protein [Treponema sp.]
MRLRVHPLLREVAALFAGQGKQVFLVGGAVRDLILGREARDWDLATDARPEEVISLFRSGPRKWPVIPTGIKHGTVTVRYRGRSIEVTTFRTESEYSDGRRPDAVRFAASIGEDLSRRDFTMNAAALSLPGGELRDPFDGAGDIKRRIIRCVGNPGERFAEDGLRPLRALRFASQLGFKLEAATLEAVPRALGVSAKVAPERVRDEFDKIIASPKPSAALVLMEKTGLLELFLPELAACRGIEQRGFHRFDVLDHSLAACDYAAFRSMPRQVRLAALFHDIGKPLVRKRRGPGHGLHTADTGAIGTEAAGMDAAGPDTGWTFYQHERESVRLTRDILVRFRYPNAVTGEVLHLIAEHMFHYDPAWSDAAVRRFIIRAGEASLGDLCDLRRADAYAVAGLEPAADFLMPMINRVEAVLAGGRALSLKNLAVDGKDLMEAGIGPGKTMGIILRELLEAVVEDPELNTRKKLLEIAGNIKKRYEGRQIS